MTNFQFLELTLNELLSFSQVSLSTSQKSYLQVLIAYFRFSAQDIETEMNKNLLETDFLQVAQLRKSILLGQNLSEVIDAWIKDPKEFSPQAKAEMFFCLTTAGFKTERYEEASRFALEARVQFIKIGCKRKSVKSFLNYIVAQSNLHPDSRFFQEYSQLSKEAEMTGEWGAASIAHINISREYERVGAFDIALSSADKALSCAENIFGGREHGLALLQKAAVCQAMGFMSEVENLLLQIKVIDHPEVQENLHLFQENKKTDENSLHQLQRYAHPDEKAAKLGSHESQLIHLLSQSERSSRELENLLFSDVVNPISRRERLKNLISRVRKKNPGLILFTGGKYLLSEVESSRLKMRNLK